MQFVVIDVDSGVEYCDPNTGKPYASTIEALTAASEYRKNTGRRARIQQKKESEVTNDTSWMAREQARFDDGSYLPLPIEWTQAEFWKKAPKTHFAHRAKTDPTKIAYTPDNEHGVAGKKIIVSPTKYLSSFFPFLMPHQIRDWGDIFENDKYTVKIGMEAKDFREAFIGQDLKNDSSAYSSCMRYDNNHFGVSIHPCEVYARGDFGIATLIAEDGHTIMARVLVWPAKKFYSRTYAYKERFHNILRKKLEAMGYVFSDSFVGAKLHVVSHKKYNESLGREDHYVVPYIDASSRFLIMDEDEKGGCFVLTSQNNGNVATSPDAVIRYRDRENEIDCGKCGRSENKNTCQPVQTPGRRGALAESFWCARCVRELTFLCSATHLRYSARSFTRLKIACDVNPRKARGLDFHTFNVTGDEVCLEVLPEDKKTFLYECARSSTICNAERLNPVKVFNGEKFSLWAESVVAYFLAREKEIFQCESCRLTHLKCDKADETLGFCKTCVEKDSSLLVQSIKDERQLQLFSTRKKRAQNVQSDEPVTGAQNVQSDEPATGVWIAVPPHSTVVPHGYYPFDTISAVTTTHNTVV